MPAILPQKIVIESQAFIAGAQTNQVVEIWINGVKQTQNILTQRFGNQIEIPLPASIIKSEILRIDFVFPSAISPKALGIGIDERPLAIGLEVVRYE